MNRASEPFLLAHHPACEKFEHHTIVFRGRRLCMGCFVMYPVAASCLFILLALNGIFPLDYVTLLLSALFLFGLNLIRKLIYRDNVGKGVHAAFRAVLGASLALTVMSVILASGKDRVIIAALALSIAIVYNVYNGRRNLNVCKTCPQNSRFPKCEGLADQLGEGKD